MSCAICLKHSKWNGVDRVIILILIVKFIIFVIVDFVQYIGEDIEKTDFFSRPTLTHRHVYKAKPTG